MFSLILSAIGAVAASQNTNTTLSDYKYTTVDALDITAYEGQWYQMYDNKRAEVYNRDSHCTTATYGSIEGNPNAVSVHNSGTLSNGDFKSIDGQATSENPEEPGQLVLNLDGVQTY